MWQHSCIDLHHTAQMCLKQLLNAQVKAAFQVFEQKKNHGKFAKKRFWPQESSDFSPRAEQKPERLADSLNTLMRFRFMQSIFSIFLWVRRRKPNECSLNKMQITERQNEASTFKTSWFAAVVSLLSRSFSVFDGRLSAKMLSEPRLCIESKTAYCDFSGRFKEKY